MNIADYIKMLEENFHKKSGLLILLIGYLISIFYIWNKEITNSNIWISLITIIFFVAIYIWFRKSFNLPSIPSNNIGIVFCLDAGNYNEYKYIKEKLIRKIERRFEEKKEVNFKIEFVPFLRSKSYRKKAASKNINLPDNWNVLIFGPVDSGKRDNINLIEVISNISVKHLLIPQQMKKELEMELSHLVNKYLIRLNNDLDDCEKISIEIELICEYVIGISALLSGVIDFSFNIFKELHSELNLISINRKSINYMKSKINNILYNNAILISEKYLENFYRNNLKKDLENSILFLEHANNYIQETYDYHLQFALLCFLKDRDIKKSRNHLTNCRKIREGDIRWQYSVAFLDAYVGDLKKAEQRYKRILKSKYKYIINLDSFMEFVIENEPEKIQLYYVLGLISYELKEDFILTTKYFNLFLKKSEEIKDEEFKYLRERCSEKLNDEKLVLQKSKE